MFIFLDNGELSRVAGQAW